MPRWTASLGFLVGIYFATMAVAAFWMPHEWDWDVLKWLSAGVPPMLSSDVSIVDVNRDPSDVPAFRRRIAEFLDGLVKSSHRPGAVILDVEFVPCQSNPCGEPMASARAALVASIHDAARHFPVYATEEPQISRDDVVIGPLDAKDPEIYRTLSGAAQTRFISVPSAKGLFYRICYAGVPLEDATGTVEGVENIWAMVARVLMTPHVFAASPPCDQTHVPVRLGPSIPMRSPFVYKFNGERSFAHYADFDDKAFVIVGTMRYDRLPFNDRSGPEVLAWALSNALDEGALVGRSAYYDVLPQNGALLLLIPLFSAISVLAYAAVFVPLRRARLRGLRALSPWICATFAATVGLAVFAAFEGWLFLSHHLQPQVSLIAFGVLLASGLSGVRGSQLQAEESAALDAPAGTETYDYDVFVSYAHGERDWVVEHVVRPLRAARLADGRKLAIFFDDDSIRAGTAWQTKIALAIDASRFIIPVYSTAYFSQPYCRFEILRAHRKWIRLGMGSRCVLPIMRGYPDIPADVDDIQAISIDARPDIVDQHVTEIVASLSRRARPSDTTKGAPTS
jgi:TIR domain